MKKILPLFFITILAAFLRLYQLADAPPSLYWDEASISYNAYSIYKTGADEYGTKWPLSFRSYDDFKPPVYIYLTAASIALFGWNDFAVRFPSALFGILTVITSYFLLTELFKNRDIKIKILGLEISVPLIGTLILAISPWHLQFSRPAFEANVGLFFLLTGLLFFLKGLQRYSLFIPSAIFFAISMYTYHSFRVVTPVVIIVAALLFLPHELKKKRGQISAAIFFILIFVTLLPIEMSFLSKTDASARLSQVTIFNVPDLLSRPINFHEYDISHGDKIGSLVHNRRFVYIYEIIKGYFDHFNINFLFLTGDSSKHHHAVDTGMMYLWEILTVGVGGFMLLKRPDKRIILLFLLILIAPLPASVTTGTPHAVRAILMLFPLHALSAYGLLVIVRSVLQAKSYLFKGAALIIIEIVILLNFYYYTHQYFIHTPVEYGDFWQYGYKELHQKLKQYEKNYDTVIVTYEYDHPDTYYLLYNKIDPVWYQGLQKISTVRWGRFDSKIERYRFKKIVWELDKREPNALLAVAPSDVPKNAGEVIDEVRYLDGRIAFLIIKPHYEENSNE